MTIEIPGRLPGLNQIIKAAKAGRGKYQPYARMKHEYGDAITYLAKKLPNYEVVDIKIKWYEPDTRRDIDNIAAGGTKFILDALVNAGTIKDDSHKYVKSISHEFLLDRRNPRVEVTVEAI